MMGVGRRLLRLMDALYVATEYLLLMLIPRRFPGPVLSRLFRFPIWLYRMGCGWMVGRWILLVITTGRRTGRPHVAAVDYRFQDGTYFVMAGWGGRPDWYRNLRAHPAVEVQVGRRRFRGRAELVSDERRERVLAGVIQRDPLIGRVLERWGGVKWDGSPEALRALSEAFPVVALHPAQGEAPAAENLADLARSARSPAPR